MKLTKSIFIEELTRTMAIVGIVMFGVLPIADILNADLILVALIAFPVALLSFPIMLFTRTRTEKDYKIRSKKGLKLLSFISYLIFVTFVVLRLSTGHISPSQMIIRIVVGGLLTLALALVTARTLKLK
jgi:hypothetical protein